jgi:DNA-binding transcriptional regulator YiaG
MTPSLQKQLANIHEAEQLLQSIKADIADSWRTVGTMLRELRLSRRLTQAQAAALIPTVAATVQRWEHGNCANINDIQNYIKKLEEHV